MLSLNLNKRALCKASGIILLVSSLTIIAFSLYLPAKAWLSQQLIANSWAKSQATKKPSLPWAWADTTAIAKMQVPRLKQSIILLKGTDPTTLAFSAGVMHEYSTLMSTKPFVVAGHRDTHFSFLADLRIEDTITLADIDGNKQSYRVEHINIIDSDNSPLLIDTEEPKLMLITCYPFDAITAGGSLRYVVSAKKLNE